MKKEYQNPTTNIVVLNLSEQITKWGDGANPSNTGTHTEAKEQSFDEEEENLPDYVGAIKFRNVWDEDDN